MAPKIQWPLVLFSLLAGCGGCAFAFAGLANALGAAPSVTCTVTIVSFVVACIGGLCSVVHLATPKNAWAVVTHILSFSGISVELIALGVTCALMVAFVASVWLGAAAVVTLVLGLAGALAGVWLAFATGHGYLISSKPTWNTMKLPVAYLATSFMAGGFLYLTVLQLMGAETPPLIVVLAAAGVVFSVVAVLAYMAHLGTATATKDGRLFWGGIVACGMGLPVLCAALMLAFPNAAFSGALVIAGLAASLIGGLSLRMLMWIVGAGFLSFFVYAQEHRSVILNVASE